ncbi:hypothetical protein Tco_0631857 [Tanacetum coccineum]
MRVSSKTSKGWDPMIGGEIEGEVCDGTSSGVEGDNGSLDTHWEGNDKEEFGGFWNIGFVDLKETIEANVSKETLDIVGFVVNVAVFNRIECAKATPTANLPYGMFLTRLYRHVMETYPHLDNGIYDIVERVMRPLSLRQTRQPRILPSPTTYLNSLHPLNYQNHYMPSSSEQTDETLFARQTTLLNQMQRMHEEMRGGFKSFEKHLKECLARRRSEDIGEKLSR